MRHANWTAGVLGERCAGCGQAGVAVCRGCRDRAARAVGGRPPSPHVAALVAGWEYAAAPRRLVLALKERGRRACSEALAEAAAAAAWRSGLAADLLTWVPARRGDVRRRGYDHGEVLARALGARLGLPVAPLLVRRRETPDQVGLSASARRINLRGVFAAPGPVPARVALVDDVLTTGATAAACAAALRRAGARRVEVVVACRTPSRA